MSSDEPGLVEGLAHNSVKVRERSVKMLRRWLSREQEVNLLDLMKIQKGLYYCFWMSDKINIQQDLAKRISSLFRPLRVERAVLFFETFLATIIREWSGLDRLRMDKYFSLLRYTIFNMLAYMQDHDWSSEVTEPFIAVLYSENGLLSPEVISANPSLFYHICDVFISELCHVLRLRGEKGKPTTVVLVQLLIPYIMIVCNTQKKIYSKYIYENVFMKLCNIAESSITDDTDSGEDDLQQTYWQDHEYFSNIIFESAADEDTSDCGRSLLYKLHSTMERMAENRPVKEQKQQEKKKKRKVPDPIEEVKDNEIVKKQKILAPTVERPPAKVKKIVTPVVENKKIIVQKEESQAKVKKIVTPVVENKKIIVQKEESQAKVKKIVTPIVENKKIIVQKEESQEEEEEVQSDSNNDDNVTKTPKKILKKRNASGELLASSAKKSVVFSEKLQEEKHFIKDPNTHLPRSTRFQMLGFAQQQQDKNRRGRRGAGGNGRRGTGGTGGNNGKGRRGGGRR